MESILSSTYTLSEARFFDSDTSRELWDNLNVVKVQFRDVADATSKPFQITTKLQSTGESGTTVKQDISQVKVITPTVISVEGIVLSIDAVTALLSAFNSDELLIDVISKSVMAKSMAIESIRLLTSSQMMNGHRVQISLRQAFPPESFDSDSPEQPADSKEYGTGINQPQDDELPVDVAFDSMVD